MTGQTNLSILLKTLQPDLNPGEYVFVSVKDVSTIDRNDTVMEFREAEGITLILEKAKADALGLSYDFVASWITLKVHSALDAVGLTAAFAAALGKSDISCNVVAGFYHDHIFVAVGDAGKAVEVLEGMSGVGE